MLLAGLRSSYLHEKTSMSDEHLQRNVGRQMLSTF